MDLFEHQGKDLFARHGIPLSPSEVAETPEEARAAATRLGGRVAVKAQVQLGGRGKAGGIALVGTPDEAQEAARQVLVGSDATLVEVNPLALLTDGTVMPLDAKVTIDDNALYRQPEMAALRSSFPVDPTQALANEKGLQYVKLDGEVGIIGNGAGLVMSTLDVVTQAGGKPANFLDVGGGASADAMATSLEVVLSDPAVRSVLVNIFGGITRGDLVAKGIVESLGRVDARVPIVVRLDGTNAEEGRRILEGAAHPRIVPAATMLEAARAAVELAAGGGA